MKNTSTLQIKGFPADLNKTLKIQSVKMGVTFRQYIINVLSAAAK